MNSDKKKIIDIGFGPGVTYERYREWVKLVGRLTNEQ